MENIGIVSNTITTVFKRKLKNIVEFPLDSIYLIMSKNLNLDYLIVLVDDDFYIKNTLEDILNMLTTFRSQNSAKIILSNSYIQKLDLKILQENVSDLMILDIYSLVYKHGYINFINEKNGYLFQTPFTKLAVQTIVDEIQNLITISNTKRKKLICVDADNTLWGGILGEDGIDKIQIDKNYPGIIYKKFQEQLFKLKQDGIVLALVSKNNLDDIKEVFNTKNMPLKLEDFISLKVNWDAKSKNISTIVSELNIGFDSVLFIDDSDFELQEVKTNIGVEVLKVSKDDIFSNLNLLENIPSLQSLYVTQEDKQKDKFYKDEKKRAEVKNNINSLDEYIKSLDIKIEFNINNKENLTRITQLINKTNQFNLTIKRYTQTQVENFMYEINTKVFDFKVSDKFGDMGLVGVVIVKNNFIDTFLLSCRSLGRDIEKDILCIVKENCQDKLKAQYITSDKNMQVEFFYENNGFVLISKKDNMKLYSM